VDLDKALDDPNLFGPFFAGLTWANWRVVIRALFALPPRGGDLEVYRSLTGREHWPTEPFSEACLIIGRRGGKSRVMALIAVFLACFRKYDHLLAPGQAARICILARDRNQAGEILSYVIGLLEAVPLLNGLMVGPPGAEEVMLATRVVISVTSASYRAVRGYTLVAAVCDEVAFWQDSETSLNPAQEILRAIRPGMATIPNSLLVTASSPYARAGELYSIWRKHYGVDGARVLVVKAPSLVMNPGLDPRIVDEALEDDYESAKAEYLAEFRSDVTDYISREHLETLTMWGQSSIPPDPDITYTAFVDPAGGVGADSMALAIGHLEDDIVVIDLVAEWKPPFNPDVAAAEACALLKVYGVVAVTGDNYAGAWPSTRFAEHAVAYEKAESVKTAFYLNGLPILTASRIKLIDNPRLLNQISGLNRRVARGGRESIDHQPSAHDDLANVVIALAVLLDQDRRPALIRRDRAEAAAPDPRWVKGSILSVFDDGTDIGWAVGSCGGDDGRLYIMDAGAGPLRPNHFEDILEAFGAAKQRCPTLGGAGVIAPKRLQAVFGDASDFHVVPDSFRPEEHFAVASTAINRGSVVFTKKVHETMPKRLFGAAVQLRAGDKAESALRAALVTLIRVNSPPDPW
jgi:hypothetical protein